MKEARLSLRVPVELDAYLEGAATVLSATLGREVSKAEVALKLMAVGKTALDGYLEFGHAALFDAVTETWTIPHD